jgi:hypothetical protein
MPSGVIGYSRPGPVVIGYSRPGPSNLRPGPSAKGPLNESAIQMFPKLFYDFFCIFELGQQFCTSGELFIIIDFSLHIFLVV